jgi:hypothetical protein
MCLIFGILETPLVTRDWLWVQYSCGTHLKVPTQSDGGIFFKSKGGTEFPCPVHQPEAWAAQGLDQRVAKYGDRHSVDIVIGD